MKYGQRNSGPQMPNESYSGYNKRIKDEANKLEQQAIDQLAEEKRNKVSKGEVITWNGQGGSTGASLAVVSFGYYQYDLLSSCFKKNDGCCYQQEIEVKAISWGLGFGIGVDLATGVNISFTTKEKDWKAFNGRVSLQEAGSLTLLVKKMSATSRFSLGSAKSFQVAELHSSVDIGLNIDLVSKQTGRSAARLINKTQCECPN